MKKWAYSTIICLGDKSKHMLGLVFAESKDQAETQALRIAVKAVGNTDLWTWHGIMVLDASLTPDPVEDVVVHDYQ